MTLWRGEDEGEERKDSERFGRGKNEERKETEGKMDSASLLSGSKMTVSHCEHTVLLAGSLSGEPSLRKQ
jgi:hypothetical protein